MDPPRRVLLTIIIRKLSNPTLFSICSKRNNLIFSGDSFTFEFFLLVICIAIQICNAYSHSHVNKYIKSANIVPSKYIFYGNIEDLQQYKTVYHTLLIRIKFKGNVNISHSSMVEVFDDEFINEDGAKFKKVTTIRKTL